MTFSDVHHLGDCNLERGLRRLRDGDWEDWHCSTHRCFFLVEAGKEPLACHTALVAEAQTLMALSHRMLEGFAMVGDGEAGALLPQISFWQTVLEGKGQES